jgi:hypothetical protein
MCIRLELFILQKTICANSPFKKINFVTIIFIIKEKHYLQYGIKQSAIYII